MPGIPGPRCSTTAARHSETVSSCVLLSIILICVDLFSFAATVPGCTCGGRRSPSERRSPFLIRPNELLMTLSVWLEASGIKPAPEMLGAPSPITYGSSPEMLLAILHQSERCFTEIHVGCLGRFQGVARICVAAIALVPLFLR